MVVSDGLTMFEFGVACDVFGDGHVGDLGVEWYELSVCAGTRSVTVEGGLQMDAGKGLRALARADTVVVPPTESWECVPEELLRALRRAHARGARMVSLCTGAFVLAAAGLLDGRRATTHWTECAQLAESYPNVSVDPSVLYVDEGDILTSAGSAASIDLCLHVVRSDYGAEIANRLARQLVVAPHRAGGQAQYIEAPVPVGETLDLFAETMGWMREHLSEPMSVAELARRSAMSRRTFARRFAASTGTTPYQWLLNQRLQLCTRAAGEQRDAGGAGSGKQRLRDGVEPAQALHAHAANESAGLSRDIQQRPGGAQSLARAVDSEHPRNGACGQDLVMWSMSGECDHCSLECAEQRQRSRPGGWSRGDRTSLASGVDEPDAALDTGLPDPLDLVPHRMRLSGELQAQRHHDAGDVAPAEDGVAACQGQ